MWYCFVDLFKDIDKIKLLGLRQSLASAEVSSSLLCHPCLLDEKRLVAKKYCQQCNESLCINCCQFHTKVKTAKHHILIEISTVDTAHLTSLTTIQCSVHNNKLLVYFCPIHKVSACGDCVENAHKDCHVDYIPDQSTDYSNCEEYRGLQRDLDMLEKNASVIQTTADQFAERMESYGNETVNDIESFKTNIIEFTTGTANYLIAEVEKMWQDDVGATLDV